MIAYINCYFRLNVFLNVATIRAETSLERCKTQQLCGKPRTHAVRAWFSALNRCVRSSVTGVPAGDWAEAGPGDPVT